jgi:hypothetical protein
VSTPVVDVNPLAASVMSWAGLVGRRAVRLDPGSHVLVFPQPHARVADRRLGKVGPPG